MVDKRIKMGCPFCGMDKDNIQIKVVRLGLGKVYCPQCKATFEILEGKQNAIDRWNRRV